MSYNNLRKMYYVAVPLFFLKGIVVPFFFCFLLILLYYRCKLDDKSLLYEPL